ncbi:murein L,D-transpeptidase YafK [Rhodoblastus acidophilus]|nr:L,D-transpeptidase family protein [Rhodoblastus acidophilus]MCW2273915.1 murein L,D-transpeptidase YafK [Rhodoblastus acidophilus]
MTQRKWTRFLTLASASVATLFLGAWLSYEAAIHMEAPAGERAAQVAPPAPERIDLGRAHVAAAATGATLPEPQAPADDMMRASLSEDTRSLFAEPDQAALALDLRAAAPVPDVPPLQPPANAQASAENRPLGIEDRPLGIQDLRPISDASLQNERPVPVDGVPVPPRRPVGLAALAKQPAPMQIASLEPIALPTSPPIATPQPQAAVIPEAPQTVAPKAAAKTAVAPKPAPVSTPAVASAPSDSSFPNIANALAAVTASVSGENSTLSPAPDAVPVPEPVGGFKKGAQVYVRIFKREGALELWMKKGDRFALYKTYPVCKSSGRLGPKQVKGDYQSPEGFYAVSAKQLNPHSAYHLSFDVGYPNAYDRRHGYTGANIMVHGDCKSVGCFAMTNAGIDEIYGFVALALANGQTEVPVHIFPFRMTEAAIARESGSGSGSSIMAFLDSGGPKQDWSAFWRNLKEGYDLFESSRVPPTAYACGDRYEFSASAASCARIAGR